MRIIRDSDTVEFVDPSGDKLVLLVAPRRRDMDACEELERKEAFARLDQLKALGIDTDAAVAEAAAKSPEQLAEARKAASVATHKVLAHRLKALAVRLIVSGEALGGQAILESYGNMDKVSAAWVDEQVAGVWDAAIPSDADTRGQSTHAAVLECLPDEPSA